MRDAMLKANAENIEFIKLSDMLSLKSYSFSQKGLPWESQIIFHSTAYILIWALSR